MKYPSLALLQLSTHSPFTLHAAQLNTTLYPMNP